MNSYVLEEARLQGFPMDVVPNVLYINELLSVWESLDMTKKAEVLNQCRLISADLRRSIQVSWTIPKLVDSVMSYREWDHFLETNDLLMEAQVLIVTDPMEVPIDYQGEFYRDRLRVQHLLDQVRGYGYADRDFVLFLTFIFKTTHENTLRMLCKFESDLYSSKEKDATESFTGACRVSQESGRMTRVAEIAAEYYAHRFFDQKVRSIASSVFNGVLKTNKAVKGMIKRAVVKRVMRSVWIKYWQLRIRWMSEQDYSNVIYLLTMY